MKERMDPSPVLCKAGGQERGIQSECPRPWAHGQVPLNPSPTTAPLQFFFFKTTSLRRGRTKRPARQCAPW